MFFEAADGTQYAVSAIKRIGAYRKAKEGETAQLSVYLKGEENPVYIAEYDYDRLMKRPVQSFAAQPETYVLRFAVDDPSWVGKTLVVGWGISADGTVYPITADGVNDDADELGHILTPDGQVTLPFVSMWASLDELVQERVAASKKD